MGDLGQRSKDDIDLTNSCTHLDKCIFQFLLSQLAEKLDIAVITFVWCMCMRALGRASVCPDLSRP